MQIDHVVALSDAWQKGAQQWDATKRRAFANDPLELLAVDGPTNARKGDGDAATWLPPRKSFRCAYVARQIAVKARYGLWVTQAEHDAMARVLERCPGQRVADMTREPDAPDAVTTTVRTERLVAGGLALARPRRRTHRAGGRRAARRDRGRRAPRSAWHRAR